MNYMESRDKVNAIMTELNARCIAECDGTNESNNLSFYVVGKQIVIVQFWKERGGCDHYIQSPSTTWEEMEAELQVLVEARQA